MTNQKKRTTGRYILAQISCNGFFSVYSTGASFSDMKKLLRKESKSSCLSILIALSIALLPIAADAADVKMIPKLAVGGAYDDNVTFSSEEKVWPSKSTSLASMPSSV